CNSRAGAAGEVECDGLAARASGRRTVGGLQDDDARIPHPGRIDRARGTRTRYGQMLVRTIDGTALPRRVAETSGAGGSRYQRGRQNAGAVAGTRSDGGDWSVAGGSGAPGEERHLRLVGHTGCV